MRRSGAVGPAPAQEIGHGGLSGRKSGGLECTVGVDAYGRFLGYVHLQDDTLVNAEIIRQGYARANTRSRFRHLDWFRQLEREARAAGRGLWRREEASD